MFASALLVVAPMGAAQVNLLASPSDACLVESQPLRHPNAGGSFLDLTLHRALAEASSASTIASWQRARMGGGPGQKKRKYTQPGAHGASTFAQRMHDVEDKSKPPGSGTTSAMHAAFDETYAQLCSLLGIRYVLTPTGTDWVLPPTVLTDALNSGCDRRITATLRHPSPSTPPFSEEMYAQPLEPRISSSRGSQIPFSLLSRQGWISWD